MLASISFVSHVDVCWVVVLQVELQEDLVGSCVVGDVVTVLGLVKVLATGDPKPAGRGTQL